MRVCPACARPVDGWRCDCGWEACIVDGYPAFAPALARENDGFDPSYFAQLAGVEEASFWFRARNRLIIWALRRFFPRAASMLEVGCGTGYVLSGIKREMPQIRLSGSEIYSAGLGITHNRVGEADLFQMDARTVPFRDEFDLIGAFDVLEHIADDELVLRQLHAALKQGGGLMLTVPQHRFLWSAQDDAACHVRRYSRAELAAKVSGAGFHVVATTSFVSLLLPLMMASRMLKRRSDGRHDTMAELTLNPVANYLLETVMTIERILIKAGTRFPFGGSLLLVARK